MSEFKGQYFCQERNKYHLEYQNKHYYFDSTREATNFMDKIEEDNMKKQTKQGLENAPKIMQDFVISLDKKEQAKKQSFFINKLNPVIAKILQPVYDLTIYTICFAFTVAISVEIYHAYA
jgi:hypothetical protein